MVKIWKILNRRLQSGKKRINGRSFGTISIRHRGGAMKRKYRFIEYYRQKWLNLWVYTLRIEYDPNRTAFIALCCSLKYGIYFYIIAPHKLQLGSLIKTSSDMIKNIGDSSTLSNIPEGLYLNSIELFKNSGSKISRAAGTGSIIIKQFNNNYSLLKLSSKEHRLISKECFATLGSVSNLNHKLEKKKKASDSRKAGFRPSVRGIAMNPVDHPHGGRTNGGLAWRTFSGKIGSNHSTRRKNKFSNALIIISQRKQKLIEKKK
uniref:Ribosomal protein L2 n=1 Tax=Heterostelium pallidum TaxID=13642 RepID=Q5ILL2_HETPA|nr:ribosomal protein L2 [Heterostelium pallidum]AAU00598.1 ribosomal protein L2 [Heterostelium pallidum]